MYKVGKDLIVLKQEKQTPVITLSKPFWFLVAITGSFVLSQTYLIFFGK